ncbi:MAG TPA: PAS domain S-box protein, partial [Flavisolibacter sp.]|nr:PAS domain S-box protein [Flavisolibacter sp.]
MVEPKTKVHTAKERVGTRRVYFFIDSQLWLLTGDWYWELQTESLFCSDVMFALEEDSYPGTRSLIYPEDLPAVSAWITSGSARKSPLSFRVIDTWGKLREIKGQGGFEPEPVENFLVNLSENRRLRFAERQLLKARSEQEGLQLKTYFFAEKLSGNGIYTVNTITYEVYFSDGIYHLHGLLPQSLNTHLHTFTPFIHPQDRDSVVTAFETAYREQWPLNLEYRLLLNHTEVKYISHITRWTYSPKGEPLLTGHMTDITTQKAEEQRLEELKNELTLSQNILALSESMSRSAYWQINLLTRKIVYSDQVYRIYGIKNQTGAINSHVLLKFVHPEDRALVEEANRQMLNEHKTADLEFRILRPDGRVRHLRQKTQLLANNAQEMVVIGNIIDITDLELADTKLKKATASLNLYEFTASQVEEMAGIGSWNWNINSGEISWSQGLYNLLGYKPNAVQFSQRVLVNFIHPDDKKLFTDQVAMVIEGVPQTEFSFRINRKGETRQVHAKFRLVNDDEKTIFIGTIRDITTETQLQQQFTEQAILSDMLSDASLDRVYVTDVNNYIVKWNKRCEEDYGIKKEKAIGRNIFDLFPQMKTPEVVRKFERALRGETVLMEHQRSLLSPGFQNILKVPVMDDAGSVIAVLTIIHDITSELELRQELTGRLRFIEKLLEASVDRIIVLDNHMNYLFWNRKAEQYYGVHMKEVIGRNILDLFPGFVDDPSYQEFRKALRGEIVHIPANKNLEDKKGYFETYLIPIKDEKDEVTGILWIVHDLIGEYRLAQQQRKASQILESINEAYVEVDFGGRLRYMNAKAEEICNRKKEEALGTGLEDIFPD